ncbi:hypothetical protein [Emcibacter nanhaiensis]|uniref:YCII-related domain-containing protein n=1 Tax=Emcibacter nanhaiensis TaxID=1505037 RepID=A0A501PN70_9PROT|nr:hypothetical protein [Emcibacter nanhaiensis]TPD61608.1 hypothetical protein FIV46_05205 [Emcibacter nanhaiensis]
MNRYEVAIYNEAVRQAYAEGKKHPNYDKAWGDLRYLEVEAESEEDALRIVEKHHPPRHGFIIGDIMLLKEFID